MPNWLVAGYRTRRGKSDHDEKSVNVAVSRVFAPTPLFLIQKKKKSEQPAIIGYPFIKKEGLGTPLFRKGRSCLAYVLSIFKEIDAKRNEIIIPAYNAQSLAFATLKNKLKVKLVDIDQDTFFPTYETYKKAVNPNTLAVILPYNWGIFPLLSEIKKIHQLCLEHRIYWVDDFATSVPTDEYADYFDNFSPCLFFSYGKTKIVTLMDGGYANFLKHHPYFQYLKSGLMKNPLQIKDKSYEVSDIIRTLTNFAYHLYGSRWGFSMLSTLGLTENERPPKNMKIDLKPLSHGWESALEHIFDRSYERSFKARMLIFKCYHDCLEKSNKREIYLFPTTKDHVGSRFPLLLKTKALRDKAKKILNKRAIGASLGHICWLKQVDLLKPYLGEYDDSMFPESVAFQDRLLTLPAHEKMTEKDVVTICGMLNAL